MSKGTASVEKRARGVKNFRYKNRTIGTVSLLSPLTLYVLKLLVYYGRGKKGYDTLLSRESWTVLNFVEYLMRVKKYCIKLLDPKQFVSLHSNKKKKELYLYKQRLFIGMTQKCVNCGRNFKYCHTCESDNYCRRNYLPVKPNELREYRCIYDIVLDVESGFSLDGENRHLLCLICTKCIQTGEEKMFYSAQGFLDYLIVFVRKHCSAVSSKLNLIGFNSSRYDFIFLMNVFREYVQTEWTYQKDKYNYIQKGGAIIYNTFLIDKTSVWFIDILRYTGSVTSLKKVAKDLGVVLTKGAFPFEILTSDTYAVDENGFPSSRYFQSDEDYEESKKLWMVNSKCSFFKLLEHYCMLDVRVTCEVWTKLCDMYNSYVPFMQGIHITAFHGAPSMTKWVSLKMSLDVKNLESLKCYSLGGKGSLKIPKSVKIYAPNYDSYDLWVGTVYGGWVGCHYQGVVEEQLGMVDIVSHYPTSFTGYFGIMKPRKMLQTELDHFSKSITEYDLNSLPIFAAVVEVEPPSVITDFCSPLPQRCKLTLTWSYLKTVQNLNSVDIWLCAKKYGFKFKLLSGEIFTRKCLLFKEFVRCFGKMKDDGKKEKNELKTLCGKIGLNSGIGKYGEKKERNISIIVKDEEDLQRVNLLLSCNNKHLVHNLLDIIPHSSYDEYIIKEYDVTCNRIPIHIISVMFAYSRVIKMDLISKCKTNELSIFSPRIRLPTPIYGDTDSVVITARELRHLKKHSPSLFCPSIGEYNTATATFDYHITIEDLFDGYRIPETRYAMFFGLKAYMIVTSKASKLRIKGHKIADVTELCNCGSGDKKWFCIGCLEDNVGKEIDCSGVTLQHFHNCVRGEKQVLEYQRFERQLNRPIGEGKIPFSVRNKTIKINLNYKELCHKYNVKFPFCYPFSCKEH